MILWNSVQTQRFIWSGSSLYAKINQYNFESFLFDLILNVPVNKLSVMSGRVFLGWTSTKQGLMCLAQGQNAVTPVRPKPATPLSRVKDSTLSHWLPILNPFTLILPKFLSWNCHLLITWNSQMPPEHFYQEWKYYERWSDCPMKQSDLILEQSDLSLQYRYFDKVHKQMREQTTIVENGGKSFKG